MLWDQVGLVARIFPVVAYIPDPEPSDCYRAVGSLGDSYVVAEVAAHGRAEFAAGRCFGEESDPP